MRSLLPMLWVGLVTVGSSLWGAEPSPDANGIIARWCERNADGYAVHARFRRYQYDDVFKIVTVGKGECRLDPRGISFLKIAPGDPANVKKPNPSYHARPAEEDCWRWSTTEIAKNGWRLPFQNGAYTSPFLFGTITISPKCIMPFCPGFAAPSECSDHRFEFLRESSQMFFLSGKPLISNPQYKSLDLAFTKEPLELHALQVHCHTGHKTTYVFEEHEVMPEPLDTNSFPCGCEVNELTPVR